MQMFNRGSPRKMGNHADVQSTGAASVRWGIQMPNRSSPRKMGDPDVQQEPPPQDGGMSGLPVRWGKGFQQFGNDLFHLYRPLKMGDSRNG